MEKSRKVKRKTKISSMGQLVIDAKTIGAIHIYNEVTAHILKTGNMCQGTFEYIVNNYLNDLKQR